MDAAQRRQAEQLDVLTARRRAQARGIEATVVSTRVRAYALCACVLLVSLLLAWLG